FADVRERLTRLGFDAASDELIGRRVASEMTRDVQRVAGEDAGAEGEAGVGRLRGTNHAARVRRLCRDGVLPHGGERDARNPPRPDRHAPWIALHCDPFPFPLAAAPTGTPPGRRPVADPSPRIHSLRLRMAAGAISQRRTTARPDAGSTSARASWMFQPRRLRA